MSTYLTHALTSLFHLLFAKVWNWIWVQRASHWRRGHSSNTLQCVNIYMTLYTLWGHCRRLRQLWAQCKTPLHTCTHTPSYPQWPNERDAKRLRERDRLKEKDTKNESPGGTLVRLMSPLPISWWYIYFFSAFQQSPVTFKYIKSSESDKS